MIYQMNLSNYLIESIASRRTGKYDRQELTYDTIYAGMRLKIKDSIEECDDISYTKNSRLPKVGGIVISQDMQKCLGDTVTVERTSMAKGFTPAVYVEENIWGWPIEILEPV